MKQVATGFAHSIIIKEVVAAYTHSMAILTDGTVLAWGKNEQQQLGDGTQINRTLPVTVTQLANLNVKQLTGGSEYTVALLENRVVKSRGLYTHGRLGGGTILLENLE